LVPAVPAVPIFPSQAASVGRSVRVRRKRFARREASGEFPLDTDEGVWQHVRPFDGSRFFDN
jgi:hypothetical protein